MCAERSGWCKSSYFLYARSYRWTEIQTDRQTYRQRYRQTDRQTDRPTDRPESHLNGQNLDEVVYSEYIGLVWVIRILYSHHCGNLLNHGPLLPLPIVLLNVNLVGNEPCVQLLCHDGSLQYTPVGKVNQVSVSCHHEAHKSDTHSVLVEEDVRMGAIHVCGGGKRRRGNRIAVWIGKKVDKKDINHQLLHVYLCSHCLRSTIWYCSRSPPPPSAAGAGSVASSLTTSPWREDVAKSYMYVWGHMIQYSYVLNVSGSLDTKIFPQAVYTKQSLFTQEC